MDANKYNRTVEIQCPTCGSSLFRYEPQTGGIEIATCASCGREITKDDLLRENAENISKHAEEIGREFTKDVAKELRDTLRRAFAGNKYIKFK